MNPVGLVRARRRHLRRVAILYVLLATAVLVIPALLAQPRGEATHPISETMRR